MVNPQNMNIKSFQRQILLNYDLNLDLKQYNNRDRKNIYIGHNIGNQKKYFIKIEKIAKEAEICNTFKVSKIINASKKLITSKLITSTNGSFYVKSQDKNHIIIIYEWLDIKPFRSKIKNNYSLIISGIADFHALLRRKKLSQLPKSNFYSDFMYGDVYKSQCKKQLRNIKKFFKNHAPNYSKLTMGIIHNDLHIDNLGMINKKLFITDFEHLKYGPLISDIGVIILDLWDKSKGYEDYQKKLKVYTNKYTQIIKLSDYDLKNILNFSIRYLYSDLNWFTYWNKINQKHTKDIRETEKKLQLLLQHFEKI